MIPRVIHQSWKTAAVPQQWARFQQSWREHHAGWDYRLWTNADNHSLVAGHFPRLLPLYESYALDIMRADLARYLVMCVHGGLYVDLDFECLRPVEPILAGSTLVFGLEPETHARRLPVQQRGLDRIVCNAFIASVPQHPFWEHLLFWLEQGRASANVLDATGPFLLTRAFEAYANNSTITLLSPTQIYPVDNEQIRDLEPDQWQAFTQDAFAIHHWNGSWLRDAMLASARQRILLARQR